jgi:two-component system NarL family sensor kinase
MLLPIRSAAQEVLDKDSLWQQFRKSSLDTNRVNILIQLGQQYEGSMPDSALSLYQLAYELSQNLRYTKGTLRFFANATYVYNILGKYDTALLLNLKSVELAKSVNDDERLAAALGNVGNSYLYLNDYEKSIQYLLEALEIAETRHDIRKLNVLYSNLANVYRSLKQYDQALTYAEKALALSRDVKNPYNICAALVTLATVKNFQMKTTEAIRLLNEAASIARNLNDQFSLLSALLNLSDANLKMGNYQALGEICREALEVAQQIEDPLGVAISYRGLGYHYLYARNLSEAERFAKKSLAQSIQHKLQLDASKAYVLLSELSLLRNDNRAYQYYQMASDSIQELVFAQEKTRNIQRLEVQFQARARERQLQELKSEAELRETSLRQSRWLAILLAALLLLAGVASWILIRSAQQRKELAERESELNRARVLQLENEKQLMASQAVIKGQEQERGRLAKDLHDGLGGILSGIKFSLTHMKSNMILDANNALQFERSLDMLDHSIAELRRVAHNMMPEVLVKFGLPEALKSYCESIRQSKVLEITLQVLGDERRVDSNVEIICFRIVQELLNNVIKHAEATHVLVQFSLQANEVNLTVEDNGVGFDVRSVTTARGAGWASIYSRVEYLKGRVDLQSSANGGTFVHIDIPLL